MASSSRNFFWRLALAPHDEVGGASLEIFGSWVEWARRPQHAHLAAQHAALEAWSQALQEQP